MFLMKSPPLVSLRRKWEPFPPSKRRRYPVCFSESEDDITRTAVSAKVQMIIDKLQTDESPLGASHEYGCAAPKKRKGAKGRGHKLRGSGRALQERVACGQSHCPADSDGMEVEENSEFGPLLLHSDSDDSVDRDIEEAIQEYLRNKGQGVQHLPSSAENFHGADGRQQFQKEYPTCDAACDLFPTKVKVEGVQKHLAPGYLGDGASQWAASPCSTSSDDSFEQSIKAEIEQFLKEKKQRERGGHFIGEAERLDPKEAPESLALRGQKEGANSLQRSSSKRRGKALFLRPLPVPRNGSTPLKCLQAGPPEEPIGSKKSSQAHPRTAIAGHFCVPEQSKAGKISQTLWETQKEQNADSSSDDGIEEAIQLYQLEKIKKEASSQTGHAVFPKDTFQAGGIVDISTSLTIHSEKSALPGTRRKGRGKQLALRPLEPCRLGTVCAEPKKGKHCAPATNRFASCAVTFQASYRSDTAAELMCAEAILDISKTVLPPPIASSNKRSLTTNPFCLQNAPPSRQESDSNAVDSDDSIEQEIRAFLAAKSQAECLAVKTKENQHAGQRPPTCGQPGDQSRSPKRSACQTRQLSLSHKKKLKRANRHVKDKPETLSEGGCSPEDHSELFAAQSLDAGEVEALTAESSVHFGNPLSWGPRRTRVKTTAHMSQKSGTDDKSSSFDSDEDLDTAIKDLLRTKRKVWKKPKDQRVQCKKRVKFDDMASGVLEDKLSGSSEGGLKPRAAPLLKSCLTRSQTGSSEVSTKLQPQTCVKGKPKSAKALECKKKGPPKSASGPDSLANAGKHDQNPWPATSDHSSSVDSDDSIEQEIQRFLAEKAKDISSAAAGVVKPQSVPPKTGRQLRTTADNTLSKRRRKIKKAGPPTEGLSHPLGCAGDLPHRGKWTMASMEDVGSQSSGKLQTNQGIGQAEGADPPIQRPAEGHQAVPDGKRAQRCLPLGKAGNCKPKNNIKPRSSLKRKNRLEFKISSKFIESLKRARNRTQSVPKRQDLKGFEREEGVSPASELSESCAGALPKRVLGSSRETEVSEADLPTLEKFRPCAPESPGKTQAPAGRLELPSNAKASRGPPSQAPNADGQVCISETPFEGRSKRPSAVREERGVPTSPSCFPVKGNPLASPDRLADRRGRGGSPEFTGGPVEGQAPGLTNSRPSSFFVSTSIDPGWEVLPYIVLSPAQLLASRTLAVQDRRRALQVLGEKLGAGWKSRMAELPEL